MEISRQTKMYDVMFVMDPTRALKQDAALDSLEWMLIDVDAPLHRQVCQMKVLKGFVFDFEHTKHKSKAPGKKCFLIHELAWLAILWQRLPKCNLNVFFVTWEEFRDILLQDSPKQRNEIKNQVCAIIGGINVILEHNLSDLGLEESNLSRYIARLQKLGNEVTLWPHVDEQIAESKWEQVKSLDTIAKLVTGTYRPVTRLLDETTNFADVDGKVLKRESSESTKHVILPKDSPLRNDEDIQDFRRAGGPRWLIQDFAPYLLKVGEWRVMFCGGKEIYTIQTEPRCSKKGQLSFDSMRISPHWTCYTLEEMRNVMKTNPMWDSDDIMCREGGTIVQRRAGMEELSEFARKTYEALLAEDRKRHQHDFLAMSLWCRLDIGIIDIPGSEKLCYFVNEVEKFWATCMFGKLGGPLHPVEYLASESAEVLEQYLRQRYLPVP